VHQQDCCAAKRRRNAAKPKSNRPAGLAGRRVLQRRQYG